MNLCGKLLSNFLYLCCCVVLLILLTSGADPASKFREGAISVIFGNQVSLRVLYCKRDEV